MNGFGLDRFRYFNWCAVIIKPGIIIYHLTIFIKCNVLSLILFINIIKFEYYIFRNISNFKHTITINCPNVFDEHIHWPNHLPRLLRLLPRIIFRVYVYPSTWN